MLRFVDFLETGTATGKALGDLWVGERRLTWIGPFCNIKEAVV